MNAKEKDAEIKRLRDENAALLKMLADTFAALQRMMPAPQPFPGASYISGDSYTQDEGAAEVLGLLRRPAQPTEALRRAVSYAGETRQ